MKPSRLIWIVTGCLLAAGVFYGWQRTLSASKIAATPLVTVATPEKRYDPVRTSPTETESAAWERLLACGTAACYEEALKLLEKAFAEGRGAELIALFERRQVSKVWWDALLEVWGGVSGQGPSAAAYAQKNAWAFESMPAVFRRWAAEQPNDVRRYLDTFNESDYLAQQYQSASALATLVADHLRTTIPWVDGQADIQRRQFLMGEVALLTTPQNRPEVADWLRQHSHAAYAQDAIREVVQPWGRSAPDNAWTYLESLQGGETKLRTASALVAHLAYENTPKTVEWLLAKPISPLRDRALDEVVTINFAHQPIEALELLPKISDPALRSHSTQTVFAALYRQDPARAVAEGKTYGISETTIRRWVDPTFAPDSVRRMP
jgi:hypothetical protein